MLFIATKTRGHKGVQKYFCLGETLSAFVSSWQNLAPTLTLP